METKNANKVENTNKAENTNKIGFNTACENLKTSLVNVINQSGLPIGAVYFIMRDIMSNAERTYYATLNDEATVEEVVMEQ